MHEATEPSNTAQETVPPGAGNQGEEHGSIYEGDEKAVENGKGDLISREAAKEAVKYIPWCDWAAVGRTLDELEAVDAAPVVHARWIDRDGKTWCSKCGASNKAYKPPYCPHCGAKMDKEESDV